MKKLILLLCSTLVNTTVPFSKQDSVAGKEKPPINIYGTLVDQTGNSYKVENITISGLYKQIPVYALPPKPDLDPDINTTRIDLAEVYQLAVPYRDAMPTIHTFKKREYIEIMITSNDHKKTQNSYIIERRKKVYCDEINEAGPIEKELAFEAIKTITIEGYKEREKKKKNNA